MIIAPAIQTKEGKIYAGRNAHSEILILHKEEFKDAEQGFITDDLRFVDRKEALKIAEKENTNLCKLVNTDELYSEDLWLNETSKTIQNNLSKAVIIEFSKDINNADIGIIGSVENNKKVINLYKVDRNKYEPKLKIKEISRNKENLIELADNSELIGKLIFNHNESIESLIYILAEMYKLNLEE